jgi:hypothetical protein
MPTLLESVDPQHPNLMATIHGPIALFSVGEIPTKVGVKDLLTAKQIAAGSTDWQAKTDAGDFNLRPFASINDEAYRLYLQVDS